MDGEVHEFGMISLKFHGNHEIGRDFRHFAGGGVMVEMSRIAVRIAPVDTNGMTKPQAAQVATSGEGPRIARLAGGAQFAPSLIVIFGVNPVDGAALVIASIGNSLSFGRRRMKMDGYEIDHMSPLRWLH